VDFLNELQAGTIRELRFRDDDVDRGALERLERPLATRDADHAAHGREVTSYDVASRDLAVDEQRVVWR
jgi:hypothetical protein